MSITHKFCKINNNFQMSTRYLLNNIIHNLLFIVIQLKFITHNQLLTLFEFAKIMKNEFNYFHRFKIGCNI